MANGYGTSSAQLQEVMRAQAMLDAARNKPTAASQRGGVSTSGDMTEYFKGELEAQRSSRVGQQIQKYTMFPGMALGTMARYSKEIDLEKKIEGLAKMMSAGKGGADTEAIVDAITKVGGLGYMGSVAPLNVMRQKRLAYERGLKPQLGKVGTASSALDTLSMANRLMITPRVASMIYGGGMPASLQSMMGLYGAGLPMAKGAAALAGTQLPAAMTTGMGGAMTGMMPFMAAQMGLSMWKQKRIQKITAQRTSGSSEESKLSLSKNLDAQINMLASRGMIQPGEQIRIQLLKWIESHTAVMPEIWAEQKYIREEKEKGWTGASKAYGKGLGEKEDEGLVGGAVDRLEGFMSRTLAKYDIFGQLFNFITTGKTPRQFQEELETAYSRLSGEERREAKRTARSRGLSMDQSRLLEMTSRQIVDMGGSHEAKTIMLMAAQFDIQRLFAAEIMTIRKMGFGIPDNMIKSEDFEKSGLSKMFDIVKAPFSAIGNIPGFNALLNMAKMPFQLAGGLRKTAGAAWGGIRNFMLGGEDATRLLTSEEELRKEAGIYKSDQQMAYDYVGRGLPDIMEEMRFLGAVRAQLLTNIYHVVSAQLQATTGRPVSYDDRPFSEMTKKGVWSYTAGKYLDEKGLKDQQKQDQERMEIALERTFRGSGMDRLGWFIDLMTGKQRGTKGAQERLREATERVSKFEMLPWQLMEGKEGEGRMTRMGRMFGASILQDIGQQGDFVYRPEELIQAARFRQREMRGRGRAKVVPGWMGAEQERAQMALQQDIMPKIMRGLGIASGGAASIAGMTTLGLAASVASGGSLLPIMLALSAGGAAGVIPQMSMELKAAQELFKGAELDPETIRKLSLGYMEMPAGVTSDSQKKRVIEYYKRTNPDFVKEITKDEKSWFKNVNNFPYVMMALQADTTLGFAKGAQKAGISVDMFKAIGEIDDKTFEMKPMPVKLVAIGEELGGSVPMYYKDPAKGQPKPKEPPKKSNVIDAVSRFTKSLSGEEKEFFEEKIAVGSRQTGGPIGKTGLYKLHAGEFVNPPPAPGSRTLKQELKEAEQKKWEDKVLDIWESMLNKLEEIDENTEGIDAAGRGVKSKKDKSEGGLFGGLMSKLGGMLTSVFGGIASFLTGGIGLRALLGKGGRAVGRGLWGATKGIGRGIGSFAGKFGAGFMESGLGQSISNKLFDARFAARGLAKRFAPSRLLGKGVAGAKDLLTRIPGVGRAGEVIGKLGARVPGLLGRTPGALGKGAASLLGKAGGLVKGLGGVGLSALMGVGGTALGAMKAQEKYGDVIGEDLSLMQKIGLGANTGLKAMTFGLLDVEKLTGAKAARESAVKAKENLKKSRLALRDKLAKSCSPMAFKTVKDAVKDDDWASAFMSVRNKAIKPGGPDSKFAWIVDGEEVVIDIEVARAKQAKKGIEWSRILERDCESYLLYQETGNQEGIQKTGESILRQVPPGMTVDKVVEIFKKSRGQRIVAEGKKKQDEVTKNVSQKIKQLPNGRPSDIAGLAAAQQAAGIDYNFASEPTQQLGFFGRMKQAISREGGIWGAIKSTLNNMGPEASGWTKGASSMLGSGSLIWPGGDVITSPFGPRKTGLRGASTMHRGVDMRANDVVAAASGTIVGYDPTWGALTIDHGNGIQTRYLHLASSSFKKGDQVQAGQKIGVAGNTGPIPGMKKHLHFEVMRGGRKLDPELVYNSAGKFAPKYAPDIVPERQLAAKLGNKPLDPSKLKDEGAEAAGPFGYDMYDPIEIRGDLRKKVDDIQKESKRKEIVEGYKPQSAPMIIPFPTGGGSDSEDDRSQRAKRSTPVDSELDSFVEKLFADASHEFGSRYKKYAYHSNMGHSFT